MEYKIIYSKTASEDIKGIIDYLLNYLLNPQAVRNFFNDLASFKKQVSTMPNAFPQNKNGDRKYFIKNYVIYYSISEEEQKIYIENILYGKMDLSKLDI